jgi:sugar lactone lactonase YvrE
MRQVFNEWGIPLRIFGSRGCKPGQFRHPTGLAFDRAGQLVVCDRDNHRVQLFKSDGTFITEFGCINDQDLKFLSPRAAAVDRFGRIFVCLDTATFDTSPNDIQVRVFGFKGDEPPF